MEGITAYLLRIIFAALVCGIVTGLLGNKDTLGRTVRLIAGVFMSLTLISPWTDLKMKDLTKYFDNVSFAADSNAAHGENLAREELEAIIKGQTRAYILDKAKSFGADLTVEVILNSSDIPAPCGVRITGEISPYGKNRLRQIIAEDLAIALEDQVWSG